MQGGNSLRPPRHPAHRAVFGEVQPHQRFARTLGIKRAHFMGNSMGGTVLLSTIARPDCPWPVEKAIVISGGGDVPDVVMDR